MNGRSKITVRDIALCAMMAALLEAAKLALCWAANIELVSFLILLFACYLGWRVLPATVAFVGLEVLVWGVGIWTACYLYLWPLLAILGYLFRSRTQMLFWALLCGFFGLLFGALCAIPYLLIGGPAFAFSWWIAGIPFDLIHGIANYILVFLLWKPLGLVLTKLQSVLK